VPKRLEDQARSFNCLGASDREAGRGRWLALGLAWCAQASGAAVFLGVPAIAPQFAHRYGMGLRALGVAFAALTLGAGLSVVPWGSLADRVGERRVMVAGLALAALALALAAAVPARTVVLGCLLVAGVGGASASAASSRAVLTWFGSSERGFAMGIRQTALPIGAAAAALGLPRLVSAWSVSAAIAALGAACGLTAVAVAAGMSDRSLSGGRPTRKRRRWRTPLSEPRLRRLVVASALLAAPQLALSSFMVVFLHDRRGWNVTDAATLLAAVQVAGAAVRPAVGRWSDLRQNRTGPMCVAALIAATTLLALAVLSASDGLPLVAIVVAAGIATLSWNGLAALAAGELAPSDGIGLALGWQTSAVFFGGAIGGPAFTALVSVTSWSVGFAALAVPAIFAALLVRPVKRRHRRPESELLGRALASMSASICLIDMRDPSQPIVYINAAFERLTGYPAAEVLGRNWRLSEGPETDPKTAGALHDAANSGEELRVPVRHHRRDGAPYWSETLMAPVYDEDGTVTHYMSVQKDITEKTEAAQRASHMAYHDTLTGLPNRAQLQEHLSLALARAKRKGTSVALLFCDLDRFKPVNDRYGHLAGDRLLEDAARRWRSVVRDDEVLARLGGDEFVLLLGDLSSGSARDSAATAAARCADTLKLPFDVHGAPGQVIEIGVSIGIALYPEEATTPAELLLAADAAMYAAKRARRVSGGTTESTGPER
jgi:diguanylate cyclase (GGDEF)-like protein/PAS domain S-box-containing protein